MHHPCHVAAADPASGSQLPVCGSDGPIPALFPCRSALVAPKTTAVQPRAPALCAAAPSQWTLDSLPYFTARDTRNTAVTMSVAGGSNVTPRVTGLAPPSTRLRVLGYPAPVRERLSVIRPLASTSSHFYSQSLGLCGRSRSPRSPARTVFGHRRSNCPSGTGSA
jgi:hypothetical protein